MSDRKNAKGVFHRALGFVAGEKTSRFATPLIAIVMSVAAASVVLLLMGKNPLMAFASFLRGSGLLPKPAYAGGQNMLTEFMSFLGIMAPMLLASLGIIVAMKTGLFNIGVAGQMLLSGFTALVVVGYSDLPAYLAKPLVILIGIAMGGLVGALIGFLKYKFNIHEVVTSIMLNYIISYVTGFFINTYFADPLTRNAKVSASAARLTVTQMTAGGLKMTYPIGILIAVASIFLVRFLLERTVTGFELKTVGSSRNAALYAGIKVGRSMVMSMMISGILAGLAGVTYYLGYFNTIVPKDLASLGYDSIAVALLGNISPLGAVFSSFLITIFQQGSVYMSSIMQVPKEIASVITSILLLFSACGTYIRMRAQRLCDRAELQGAAEGRKEA